MANDLLEPIRKREERQREKIRHHWKALGTQKEEVGDIGVVLLTPLCIGHQMLGKRKRKK